MFAPLRHPDYRRLFAAQVASLLGTGLTTVALALLAYELAGERAGVVLGTALALKMVAYVAIAPLAGACAGMVSRRALLVGLDLSRAGMVLLLPFVTELWQVYLLVFLMQAASAAFTPTFQATIPDILPDEREYTRALTLSRLAYDLEALVSPALAAMALLLVGFDALFATNGIGFLLSAALVLRTRLPGPARAEAPEPYRRRIGFGLRAYLATPRLRGLLGLSLAAAAGGAMVIVNSVVLVRTGLGLGEGAVALALAAYGAGSMAVALLLPRLLERVPDRPVMLAGGGLICAGLAALPFAPGYPGLVALWTLLGAGASATAVPAGRLLRRSSAPADRPAYFAAQFSLSHACWLLAYPLAGLAGAIWGTAAASWLLSVLAAAGVLAAARFWPADDPEVLEHEHPDLAPDHPHLAGPRRSANGRHHAHAFVIDRQHHAWPTKASNAF